MSAALITLHWPTDSTLWNPDISRALEKYSMWASVERENPGKNPELIRSDFLLLLISAKSFSAGDLDPGRSTLSSFAFSGLGRRINSSWLPTLLLIRRCSKWRSSSLTVIVLKLGQTMSKTWLGIDHFQNDWQTFDKIGSDEKNSKCHLAVTTRHELFSCKINFTLSSEHQLTKQIYMIYKLLFIP